MFRIKLIILPLLFLVMCSPALTCDYGDGSKTNFCTCCNTTEVVIIDTYCANSTHAVANVSCWFDSGDGYGLVYSTTEQAEYFSCYYGCDNTTGACIDPSGTNNYMWMIEIAIIVLIIVSLMFFMIPMEEHYAGVKVGFLVLVLLGLLWLFLTLATYGDQFSGHLIETIGSWAGSISQAFPHLILFIGFLVFLSFLWYLTGPLRTVHMGGKR